MSIFSFYIFAVPESWDALVNEVLGNSKVAEKTTADSDGDVGNYFTSSFANAAEGSLPYQSTETGSLKAENVGPSTAGPSESTSTPEIETPEVNSESAPKT